MIEVERQCPYCGHVKVEVLQTPPPMNERKRKLTLTNISDFVTEVTGVTMETMLQDTRKKEVVFARQIGQYFAVYCTPVNLTEIGMHFGGRDHATVLHSKGKIENFLHHKYKDVEVAVDALKYRMALAGFFLPEFNEATYKMRSLMYILNTVA